MDLGDVFIETVTTKEYRLGDIDFGWFKLEENHNPVNYVWVRKNELKRSFKKVENRLLKDKLRII